MAVHSCSLSTSLHILAGYLLVYGSIPCRLLTVSLPISSCQPILRLLQRLLSVIHSQGMATPPPPDSGWGWDHGSWPIRDRSVTSCHSLSSLYLTSPLPPLVQYCPWLEELCVIHGPKLSSTDVRDMTAGGGLTALHSLSLSFTPISPKAFYQLCSKTRVHPHCQAL